MRSTVLAIVLAAACGPRPGGTGPGRTEHTLAHEWTLAPGKSAEANLHFGEGALVEADYRASDIVQWNVHSHPGEEAVTHDQGEGTYGTITFRAPSEGVYSLMWTNDNSAPVTLEVKVRGGVKLDSWHPAD